MFKSIGIMEWVIVFIALVLAYIGFFQKDDPDHPRR